MIRLPRHYGEPPRYAACYEAGTIALIVAGVGAAASAYGAVQSGRDAQKTANLQASILEQNAEAERQAAAASASQFAKDDARDAARLRALICGTGLQSGTGTPLLVQEDRAAESELQRLKILHGGETAATSLRSQGTLARAEGAAARRKGLYEGASRLLTGGANVYGAYKTGAFGT